MLSEKQVKEIREHLESSQNPLFFFDNDADGLCSFLLLRRYVGRGTGVAVKSYPALDEKYSSKIREHNPDKIFILDKPVVSEGFFEYTKQNSIPVVWIDHHPIQKHEGISYYNPLMNDGKNEPVSYLCWQVTKKDEWVSMIGCIGDYFLPDFFDKFKKEHPDMVSGKSTPPGLRYESNLGKLTRIIEFALKDKVSNVIKMMNALVKAHGPQEILKGEKPYDTILRRYEQIKKKYDRLLGKALEQEHGNLIFFRYSGDLSISAEISNELLYHFPKKLIAVAFVQGDVVKASLRGGGDKDLRVVVSNIFKEIEGSGGGHARACGMVVKLKDIDRLKELLEKYVA